MNTKSENKKLAGVCGLYCGACNAYIATTEDPERLTALSQLFQMSEDTLRCHGCRSDKKGPYCPICKMAACAAEKGIDFCVECAEYPCDDLKQFQAEAPHRLDLWESLARIVTAGWETWMQEAQADFSCPECGTVNSAYDAQCRHCGTTPSCGYVECHQAEIAQYLQNNAQQGE